MSYFEGASNIDASQSTFTFVSGSQTNVTTYSVTRNKNSNNVKTIKNTDSNNDLSTKPESWCFW